MMVFQARNDVLIFRFLTMHFPVPYFPEKTFPSGRTNGYAIMAIPSVIPMLHACGFNSTGVFESGHFFLISKYFVALC